MHVFALKRSDGSIFPCRFGHWFIRLFLLASIISCVHWICSVEPAWAVGEGSVSTYTGSDADMNKGVTPDSQRSLAERYEELSRRYDEQKKELTELREEYDRLRVSRQVRWYLLGAAVFLVGWIIGFSARRKPKRYTLES